MRAHRHRFSIVIATLMVAMLQACTPELNWRTVTLPSGQVGALFPCRPESVVRPIRLAGHDASMRLLACSAAGSTYSLAEIDVSDGYSAESARQSLLALSTANIGGQEAGSKRWQPKGSKSHAERVLVTGRLPDGTPVFEHRASLVANAKVYRLSVMGAAPSTEAVDTFFDGFTVISE